MWPEIYEDLVILDSRFLNPTKFKETSSWRCLSSRIRLYAIISILPTKSGFVKITVKRYIAHKLWYKDVSSYATTGSHNWYVIAGGCSASKVWNSSSRATYKPQEVTYSFYLKVKKIIELSYFCFTTLSKKYFLFPHYISHSHAKLPFSPLFYLLILSLFNMYKQQYFFAFRRVIRLSVGIRERLRILSFSTIDGTQTEFINMHINESTTFHLEHHQHRHPHHLHLQPSPCFRSEYSIWQR